jgi:hypothetical protein
MQEIVKDALESVRTVDYDYSYRVGDVKPQRKHSLLHVKTIVKAFIQELPEDMSVMEILEELQDG